ncbi:hypothetical protein NST58_12790 [Paenibacillus sp. FSL R10-2796]|uniref:hypothetical protein n=1 Tax=Paenibacillus sp. FSL R10-2796 TaxID=2954663 RepID=UPI0030D7A1F7
MNDSELHDLTMLFIQNKINDTFTVKEVYDLYQKTKGEFQSLIATPGKMMYGFANPNQER